LEFVEPHQ
jgi:hypothetical protein